MKEEKRMSQLENAIGMKKKEILFDSNKDDWKQRSSVFGKEIMEKSQVVILIETSFDIVFGCYICNTIDSIDKYIQYAHSLLFTFKDNDEIKICERKNFGKNVIKVYNKNDEKLVEFGNSEIVIMKEGKASLCQQQSNSVFNYHNENDRIVGVNLSDSFIPNRIQIIQFEESDEQKNARIEIEKECKQKIEDEKKRIEKEDQEREERERKNIERIEKERIEEEEKRNQIEQERITKIQQERIYQEREKVEKERQLKEQKAHDEYVKQQTDIWIKKICSEIDNNIFKLDDKIENHPYYLQYQINTNKFKDLLTNLMTWTSTQSSGIVFDSQFDTFSMDMSSFNRLILGRSKLAFIIQTMEGFLYGCYIFNKIHTDESWIVDKNAFMFSYTNGMKKYPIKSLWQYVFSFKLCSDQHPNLFYIGTEVSVGKLCFTSNCVQSEYSSYGCPNIFRDLLGRNYKDGSHIATRIVVVQFQ